MLCRSCDLQPITLAQAVREANISTAAQDVKSGGWTSPELFSRLMCFPCIRPSLCKSNVAFCFPLSLCEWGTLWKCLWAAPPKHILLGLCAHCSDMLSKHPVLPKGTRERLSVCITFLVKKLVNTRTLLAGSSISATSISLCVPVTLGMDGSSAAM